MERAAQLSPVPTLPGAGGWLHRRPEPGFLRSKKNALPCYSQKNTEKKMGLEDRDWYREEQKQKRRAQEHQSTHHTYTPPPRARQARPGQPPPDLSAYVDAFARSRRASFIKWLGLFIILCLAIYGTLAVVRDLRTKPTQGDKQQINTQKQQPPNSAPPSAPPPRPAPVPSIRYL